MNTRPDFDSSPEYAHELDSSDTLHSFRNEFHIPDGIIYMDGNSLGLAPERAEKAVLIALEQWKSLAIRGWLESEPPWFELGEHLGRLMAPLVGAEPDEVVVTGTTTVNQHQLLSTFYQPSATRHRIVADELNFPSDLYALRSQLRLRGRNPEEELVLVRSRDGRTILEEDIEAAFNEEVAVALLPSVLYRSGQLLDLERLTAAAHRHGIVIGFDCSHSTGIVPHAFDAWGVDFAFWCNYKYVNGGPGATGALYVNRRHFGAEPGLAGWWGSSKEVQFELRNHFDPAPHAGAWQISTPPVLSTAALVGSLELLREAGSGRLRAKSLALTGYLMKLIDERLASFGFRVGTPRERHRRGGHVALEHPEHAVAVNQALKARGVIPDFRPPNVIRLAPTALYNTFQDCWTVVEQVHNIMTTGHYREYGNKPDPVA